MKFNSGFTAFVVASVATAHLSGAAPVNNGVSQSNSQGTSQQAAGKDVLQTSDSVQANKQGVKISSDDAWKLSHPAIAVPPKPKAKAPASSGGSSHPEDGGGKTGDLIDVSLLNGNKANVQAAGTGDQANKRSTGGGLIDLDALNGNDANVQILGTGNQKNWSGKQDDKKKSHQAESDDLVKAALLNGNDANAQVAGTGNQADKSKRQLFAQGKQGASADGFGGSSQQGQTNTPVLSGSGNSLTSGGSQFGENNGQGGDITQKLLQQLQARQFLDEKAGQGASANGYGGQSAQGQSNAPVLSGSGNSLTAGGAQQAQNDGTGGQIQQGLQQVEKLGSGLFGKRQLFSSGKQGASADGHGGSSLQGEQNAPVLSGAGNSLTAGGAQGAENNGQGGDIQQTLAQKLGLGKRQLFASGSQKGSADGFGGSSFQGQSNAPVVSGAGNSVTTGGEQLGENDGTGGSISQSLAQQLGLSKRQFEALGQQGASANGYSGDSWQYQSNRPVVSGTGNSVTAGGAQGAENNGQGGSIEQGLKQLFGKRQYQGLGQGIGQGIDQTGSANAQGGSAYIYGNKGPATVDGTATAGTVNQGASGYQDGAQSATQGLSQQTLNRFFARQLQDLQQGIGQGVHQNGQADAQGGSAYLVGGNGPAYVNNGAAAGSVNQNGQAQQQAQQSGTQSLDQQLENLWSRRGVQDQGQGTAQTTSQQGWADAQGGNVKIVGSGNASGPVNVDSSSHAGVVDQDSSSNQKNAQDASQQSSFWVRGYGGNDKTLAQGNSQNTNAKGDASAHAATVEAPHVGSGYFWTYHPDQFVDNTAVAGSVDQDVHADQANSQQASQKNKRAVPSALYYGNQNADADSHGGSSSSFETNDKVVQGNGNTSNQGGAQTANGSSTGGSIKQLLQL